MKRRINRKRIKIRPMRGPVVVKTPEWDAQELIEFIGGMGYLIYENPTDEQLLIITDKAMTYRDYRKSRLVEGSEEWFDETYSDCMADELEEYRW